MIFSQFIATGMGDMLVDMLLLKLSDTPDIDPQILANLLAGTTAAGAAPTVAPKAHEAPAEAQNENKEN